MPEDFATPPQRRVAVIGGGISGLGAAHKLAGRCAVTVFEAAPRLGGHAHTVLAGRNGDQPVDVGFIVFNYATYPLLTALFEELEVPVAKSAMTFAASLSGGRTEYALNTLDSLFGQRRNAVDPRFWRMLRDIGHFNARAEALVAGRAELTIAGLLDRLGTGARFRDHYLLPFAGAIWSTPVADILEFPAEALLRFFRNHALLGASGQHQWYTVAGGSIAYVRRLEASLRARGVTLRPATPVEAVQRDAAGATLRVGGALERFDEVVLATHSDQALRLLADPSAEETLALSAIGYRPNRVVLHNDPALMPTRRRCWASWNYVHSAASVGADEDAIALSYWMNSLQPIPQDDPLFVSLNPTRGPRDGALFYETEFAHPQYTVEAIQAQADIARLNGRRNTWFCGAWMRNGFHEDGLWSGYAVAEGIAARSVRAAA